MKNEPKFLLISTTDVIRVSRSKIDGVSFSDYTNSFIKNDISKDIDKVITFLNGYMLYHFKEIIGSKLPGLLIVEQVGAKYFEYLTGLPIVFEDQVTPLSPVYIKAGSKVVYCTELSALNRVRHTPEAKIEALVNEYNQFYKHGKEILEERKAKAKKFVL